MFIIVFYFCIVFIKQPLFSFYSINHEKANCLFTTMIKCSLDLKRNLEENLSKIESEEIDILKKSELSIRIINNTLINLAQF